MQQANTEHSTHFDSEQVSQLMSPDIYHIFCTLSPLIPRRLIGTIQLPYGRCFFLQQTTTKQSQLPDKCQFSTNITPVESIVAAKTQGIIIFPDGSYYQGHLRKGLPQGYGREVNMQSIYMGDWKKGVRQGKGSYYDRVHKRYYNGQFVKGQIEGKGKLVDKYSIYEGQFINGAQEGHGIMTFRNGHVFNGVFHKGKCRFGRYNTGKEYYEGMMGKNDQPHGLGLYCYEDGVRYVGMWSDGKQHGEGWEVGVLGVVRKGLWNDGCWQRWFQLGQ